MKALKALAVAALSVSLAACEPGPGNRETMVLSQEWRTYRILDIDPPKHFHVDLIDVETMQYFKDEGRRKHCNAWRKWEEGQDVRILTERFHFEGDPNAYLRLKHVAETFCG